MSDHEGSVEARPLPFDERYRCKAISTTTGERCRRRAHPGATVCTSHGAGAPQVKAKAKARLDKARAAKRLGKLLADLELETVEAHPIDVLSDAVSRSQAMVQVLGTLVGRLEAGFDVEGIEGSDLPDDEWERSAKQIVSELFGPNHLGDGAPHVLVTMYQTWIDRAGKLAAEAVRIGLDERRVRLQENTEKMMVLGVIRGIFMVLDRFDRMLTADQKAQFRGFMVEDSDDGFTREWAHHLDYVEALTDEERRGELARLRLPRGSDPNDVGRVLRHAAGRKEEL